jgi:hypothetical protein
LDRSRFLPYRNRVRVGHYSARRWVRFHGPTTDETDEADEATETFLPLLLGIDYDTCPCVAVGVTISTTLVSKKNNFNYNLFSAGDGEFGRNQAHPQRFDSCRCWRIWPEPSSHYGTAKSGLEPRGQEVAARYFLPLPKGGRHRGSSLEITWGGEK